MAIEWRNLPAPSTWDCRGVMDPHPPVGVVIWVCSICNWESTTQGSGFCNRSYCESCRRQRFPLNMCSCDESGWYDVDTEQKV